MKLSHSSFRAFDGISGSEFIDELCLNDLNTSAITNISADLYGKTYSLAGYHIATGLYGKKIFVSCNKNYDKNDLKKLDDCLKEIEACFIDGVLFYDLAVLELVSA